LFSYLERLYRGAMAVTRWITYAILATVVVSVAASVVIRYFGLFGGSLYWVDELSRFTTIWMVMLGSAIALDARGHVAINVLPHLLPHRARKIINVVVDLSSALFVGVLGWYGYVISFFTMRQISPSLQVPMGYVYLAIPVSCTMMLARLLLFVARPSRPHADRDDDLPSDPE
jgi:TRAP-type C4-dicarboxylate transport system permease small subunit